jgi:hypothetical protein
MPAAIASKSGNTDVFGSSLNDFDPFAEDDEGCVGFATGVFDDDIDSTGGGGGGGMKGGFSDFVDFGGCGSSDEDEEFFKSASSFDALEIAEETNEKPQSKRSMKQHHQGRRPRSSRDIKKPNSTKELHGSFDTLTTSQSEGSEESMDAKNRGGSKSPGPHSRRSSHRSRSGSGSGQHAVTDDEDQQAQSGDDGPVRRPPMRRRSSNRRALMAETGINPPRRPSRSLSADRDLLSLSVEENGDENENDEEIKPVKPKSLTNRRAGLTSSQRQMSSRRLVSKSGGRASLRNLFSEGAAEPADNDEDDNNNHDDDKSCMVSVCHSVVQRPSSRRGNLNRSFSGLKSPTANANRKLHSSSADRPTSERRLPPQRSVSATVGRNISTGCDVLLSPGVRSATEGSDDPSTPGNSGRRSLRRAPPPRSASLGGTLNRHSQLQRRPSTKAPKHQLQQQKEEEE